MGGEKPGSGQWIQQAIEGYTFKDKTTKREITQSVLLKLFKHSNPTEIKESNDKIREIKSLKPESEVSMEVTLPELTEYEYIVGHFDSRRTLPAQTIKLNIKFTKKSIEFKEIEVDYEVDSPDKIETVAIYDTAFFQTKRYYVIKIQNQKFVLTNSWFEPGTLVHSWFGPDGHTYQFDLENILWEDIQKFKQLQNENIKIYSTDQKKIVSLNIKKRDLGTAFHAAFQKSVLDTAIVAAHDYNYLAISEVQSPQPTTPQA